MTSPVFAIVGHPNKGKSSVVSTLAHDDSVAIFSQASTTLACRAYPMKIDGELIYTLMDTPGFQRARGAWDWLQQQRATAAERRAAVERFVEVHRDSGEFPDECELLVPVLEGAGILYVVDGSLPYGPEYEAEMEILRWTGQPSLALINCIGSEDHIEQWRAALRQYFQVVRVFDAVKAPFEARLELLRAFGQLEPDWSVPLLRAVETLESERARQHRRAARAIGEMLADVLSESTSRHLSAAEDPKQHHDALEREFMEKLRKRERRGRIAVEGIYDQHVVERSEAAVELLDSDLFSTNDWYFWGLNRRQLVTAGATGGAVVGGAVDVALGGASFFLGSLIGAAAGGATAVFGGSRLTQIEILALPLGGLLLQCGPTRHENFPYVVLGRALHHRRTIAGRTHADRTTLALAEEPGLERIGSDTRKSLDAIFRRLRGGAASHEVCDGLTAAVAEIIDAE
ncbi:MAG: DUF3482 domain-containing protein [Myxococcota bacterium]